MDAAVEDIFRDIRFTSEPEGLYDPLRYMISIGGKRLRPSLCLTAYSLYKDSIGPEIIGPAEGLEVFHSFTLIHDDIMDHSPLRRGAETVWKKWSPDTAILSGDVMCIDSYARIAKAPASILGDVLSLFSDTAAKVCEGQQLDMDFERYETVPMEDYMTMIGLKTGVLIACSAKMGALVAGAPDVDCANLYDYGFNLGLAFQVADDYLDTYGDSKIFGKPIGGDIINGKKSWLTVRAYEKASPELRLELTEALGREAVTDSDKLLKINNVRDIYDRLDIRSEAKATVEKLSASAIESAAKSCSGERLSVLADFADRLVGRAK